jgi:hypothetical protein
VFIPEWFYPDYFICQGHQRNPSVAKTKVHRIPLCFKCNTNHTVESKGLETRRALMDEDWVTVLYRRYKCSCGNDWNGLDDMFLMSLPGFINKNLEFVFTHRAGIHKKLIRRLVHDLVSGKGFGPAHSLIEEDHLERFTRLKSQYYSLKVNEGRFNATAGTLSDFGEFRSKDKYNGYCSSVNYLKTVFENYFSQPIYDVDAFTDNHELQNEVRTNWTRELYLHRYQQMIDGTLWCIDGAYKVANLTVIRDKKQSFGAHTKAGVSSRAITSILTIFNQYEQILFQKALVTGDPKELKEQVCLFNSIPATAC